LTARLIVTADDVGLHPGMTEGALRAHREGIVTACSVAANGRHVEEAAARLRETPGLAVGIHFTLVGEAPVSPPGRVRSLLGPDDRLLDDWPALVRRYLLGRVDLDEVETELRAQTTLLSRLGLRPVHANGHQHLHVLPGVFPRVLAIAAEAGIRYLRVPRDPSRPGWARLRRHHPPPPGERLAWSVRRLGLAGLEACGALARRRAEAGDKRFVFPNMTPGIAVAGRLDTPSLLALLSGIEGLAELVVHPGVGGEEIARDYAWPYNWDAETAALCAPAVRAEIASRGIELTSMLEC
jgi:predicted glycoside hydrolase/deacetylase ChbG (UPF0249 family)